MNYLLDLRKIVGTRLLIACCAGVAIVKRADNGRFGLINIENPNSLKSRQGL